MIYIEETVLVMRSHRIKLKLRVVKELAMNFCKARDTFNDEAIRFLGDTSPSSQSENNASLHFCVVFLAMLIQDLFERVTGAKRFLYSIFALG